MSTQSSNLKGPLRERLLSLRNDIEPVRRNRLDHRICGHLVDFLGEHDALNLAGYVAFRGEPNLQPALQVLHQAGRRVHMPVLAEDRQAMNFRRWKPGAEMPTNRFGIPEPVNGHPCPPERLDVVITPLVAFSPAGVRLGMGAGFYDRTFHFRQHSPESGPLLMGAAYSVQQVDSLPAESWDVPLDGIITEKGCSMFTPRRVG